MDCSKITVRTAPNIAIVKYWGKSDVDDNIPYNSSLSLTLDSDDLNTTTTVSLNFASFHNIIINGKKLDETPYRINKMINYLQQYSKEGDRQLYFNILSENSFPTASGLASSASMSSIAIGLAYFYQITNNDRIAEAARIGSGSACRSIYGGFVTWTYRKPSIPTQIYSADYWPELYVTILVLDSSVEQISSATEMQLSMQTSELIQFRQQNAQDRISQVVESIREKDFDTLADCIMKESNQLHAICLDTFPPLLYLNSASYEVIKFTNVFNEFLCEMHDSKELNERCRIKESANYIAYSFDAGPNAFMFSLYPTMLLFISMLKSLNDTHNLNSNLSGKITEILDSHCLYEDIKKKLS
ncbi:hypothetical protein GJ496_005738 [Pomphorhynchus laevis]|nr:hypothetical protein GJ496_000304 [Pomphorhynchus laevis]KAI0989090.1 hypothetical protein GJ496_005738 [Pomphorhynchus laevis]